MGGRELSDVLRNLEKNLVINFLKETSTFMASHNMKGVFKNLRDSLKLLSRMLMAQEAKQTFQRLSFRVDHLSVNSPKLF